MALHAEHEAGRVATLQRLDELTARCRCPAGPRESGRQIGGPDRLVVRAVHVDDEGAWIGRAQDAGQLGPAGHAQAMDQRRPLFPAGSMKSGR